MHLYILLTRASSGSALGSTPNSKSLAPRPIMEPPSPARMGEESSASARLGPGGTVTRWEPVPSFPFKVFMKAVSFSVFTSWIKRSEDQWPLKTRVRYGNTTLCFVWHSITQRKTNSDFFTSSPKLMISTFTFSFFKRFAILTSCRVSRRKLRQITDIHRQQEIVLQVWWYGYKNNISLCGIGTETRHPTHVFFIILHRTPNKGNDPHLVVFSLSVF